MNNQQSWDQEYQKPQLVTQSHKPQKDFLRFIKWIKNNKHIDLYSGITVLDLGCGVGRNSFYMADHYDAKVYGWDFSSDAIEKAKKIHGHELVRFETRNVGKPFPLDDDSVDIILDVTTSNALSESERGTYLKECERVLKPTGYMYVRTLAREGDKNAQKMVKEFPGPGYDTYKHPQLGVTERIFSGPDFKELYNKHLEVVRMERKTGYQRWGAQSYKRNYWNCYVKNKNA
ncbi:MAG: cyclopropane fatty-acyl-phospholipid synthase-like methyltransferase [Candidatus Paceibacteria bacterium]|jgi:cyclopropane fatty-acyl-phospholipid synthase-like methyltransferase